MRLTILGGGGVWPAARQACGGYLVEHDGYSMVIDPGYAVLPRLLLMRDAGEIDAVLISHGHLDHCADLNPLLRARAFADEDVEPLPVWAPRGAVEPLLAAERIPALTRAAELHEATDGGTAQLGPFTVEFTMLPHQVRNAGMRIRADGRTLAYTGDSGDCSDRISLAFGADVLLADATYPSDIPPDEAPYVSSARQVARTALAAGVRQTLLTHLWPDDPVEPTIAAVRREGLSSARLAYAGMAVELTPAGPRLQTNEQLALDASARSPLRFGRRASDELRHPNAIPILPRRAAAQ